MRSLRVKFYDAWWCLRQCQSARFPVISRKRYCDAHGHYFYDPHAGDKKYPKHTSTQIIQVHNNTPKIWYPAHLWCVSIQQLSQSKVQLWNGFNRSQCNPGNDTCSTGDRDRWQNARNSDGHSIKYYPKIPNGQLSYVQGPVAPCGLGLPQELDVHSIGRCFLQCRD